MSEITTQERPCAFASLQKATTSQLRSLQHYFNRRHLEASLASLVDAATGHEAQGLAPGAALYRVLQRESELLVDTYCERWQVSVERLNAEIPALEKLRRLANQSSRKTRAGTSVLILTAGMFLAFLAGIAAGLVRLGYQLLGGGR